MPGLEPPDLDWTDDGTPVARRFGDVYFSREDGLAEARTVFLAGCGLPDRWRGRRHFTVAELGFGTGLNILALIRLWQQTRPAGAHLSVFSVEAFPLSAPDLARALTAWPELEPLAERLIAQWPGPVAGFHRLDFDELGLTLDLGLGEAAEMIGRWQGLADAWFLDGFAPSRDPAIWRDAVLDAIAARSAPEVALATYTVAGQVRRGLEARGFALARRPGHGRKRERLEAWRSGPARRPGARSLIVVGAGIAAASAVRAARVQGLEVTQVHDPETPPAQATAALVTPRLDAGGGPLAELFAQALRRSRSLYRAEGVVLAEGVFQHARTPRDPARFAAIAQQPWWAAGELEPREGGLAMTTALAIDTAAVLSRWAPERDRIEGRVVEVGAGHVVLEDGRRLTADAVLLATGWRATPGGTAYRPVRGQVSLAARPLGHGPEAWGGYLVPTPGGGLLFGATHDRDDTALDPRPQDHVRNLATLAEVHAGLSAVLRDQALAAHVGIRATTPDRLPVAGRLAEGLFGLGGLGSRGFTMAPLLAEHVVSLLAERPSPLPCDLSDRLQPDRATLSRPAVTQ